MAAAFTKHADFTLYIARSDFSGGDLFRAYNVPTSLRVVCVGETLLWPRRFWQARRFLTHIIHAPTEVVWYCRDVLLADWLLFLSSRFRNRYVFELHTLVRFSDYRYKRVLSHARCIITTNEEKKKDIITRFGIPAEKVLVMPNGVDFEEFQDLKDKKTEIRKELGIDEHISLVVYAGTDMEAYGTEVLREAACLLPHTVHIEIVSGKIRNEALRYMAAADVLVAPYLAANDHFIKYMSPMKIREYMAMERPMVVSDLPAIRAYLPTDDCAFFAKSGDAVHLAEKITEAVVNMEEAKRRARYTCEMAHEKGYSWETRAKRIIDFMETYV